MSDPQFKRYRIGDFARHLGVSNEFLKHYQASGLVDAHRTPSGYRFFSFDQSARVIEYKRLRNYGFPVKRMKSVVCVEPSQAVEALSEQTQHLRRELDRLQAIVAEQERLESWFAKRQEKPMDWEIREVSSYVFLPHTANEEFLEDERIQALLPEWVAWLPVTKSAMLIQQGPAQGTDLTHWGFCIPKRLLTSCRLPVNEAVMELSFGRTFVFHFCGLPDAFEMEPIKRRRHAAYDLIRALGFRVCGDSLLISDMRLAYDDGSLRPGIGRFLIPVEPAQKTDAALCP